MHGLRFFHKIWHRLDTAEHKDVEHDPDHQHDARDHEGRAERAGLEHDEAGDDRGDDSHDAVEEVHDAADCPVAAARRDERRDGPARRRGSREAAERDRDPKQRPETVVVNTAPNTASPVSMPRTRIVLRTTVSSWPRLMK